MEQRAEKKVRDILDNYKPEPISEELAAKLDALVAQAEEMVKNK